MSNCKLESTCAGAGECLRRFDARPDPLCGSYRCLSDAPSPTPAPSAPDTMLMSPSAICKKYQVQNCHFCEDMDCGDNISEAKQRLTAALAGQQGDVARFVWLLTDGTGDDGDEWDVVSVHATRESAELAKTEYDKLHRRPDGSSYHYNGQIEKWELCNHKAALRGGE